MIPVISPNYFMQKASYMQAKLIADTITKVIQPGKRFVLGDGGGEYLIYSKLLLPQAGYRLRPRHQNGVNFLFLDGHAAKVHTGNPVTAANLDIW